MKRKMTTNKNFLQKTSKPGLLPQVKVNRTALAAKKKSGKKMAMSVHVMQVTVMKPRWMLTIS